MTIPFHVIPTRDCLEYINVQIIIKIYPLKLREVTKSGFCKEKLSLTFACMGITDTLIMIKYYHFNTKILYHELYE